VAVPEPSTPHLVVLRGNSGSGKTTTAHAVRRAREHGTAVVSQDVVRRDVLSERDRPGAANVGLIEQMVLYALEHGFDVVLEGILAADHYGPMLLALADRLPGRSHFVYLDVPFEETCRRHLGRPQSAEFTVDQMREWYRPLDLVAGLAEVVVAPAASLADVVDLVLHRLPQPRPPARELIPRG
jgi:predicted kinase